MDQNLASSAEETAPSERPLVLEDEPTVNESYQPPPRRRTPPVLLWTVVIIGVVLLLCVAGSVWILTQLGPQLQDSARELTATQVARSIAVDGQTYTLRAADLEQGINTEIQQQDDAAFDDVVVTITPAGFEVRLDLQEQDVYYSGSLGVSDGRVQVTAVEADAPMMDFVFGADDMASAIEDGFNDYFAAQGRRVVSVELLDGAVRFVTESVGSGG